jgi:hypothetical protein
VYVPYWNKKLLREQPPDVTLMVLTGAPVHMSFAKVFNTTDFPNRKKLTHVIMCLAEEGKSKGRQEMWGGKKGRTKRRDAGTRSDKKRRARGRRGREEQVVGDERREKRGAGSRGREEGEERSR